MSVIAPWMPTPRERRSLPDLVPVAATSTLLLVAGLLAGSSLRAAVRVRQMRAQGREVAPLDHDTVLAGVDPMRRLAVIGDSAAAGHGLADADAAYTRVVGRELVRRDGRRTAITNVAVDGATIAEVIDHQLEAVRDAELVIVGVGVNDAIRCRRPSYVEDAMRTLFQGIRDRAAPDVEVILISAPDLSVAPGLPKVLCPPLGVLCRATARVQERVADGFGASVIALPREALPHDVFGEDGFHPGEIGHARLAGGVLARLDGASTGIAAH